MERERGAVAVSATVLSTNWTEIISRRDVLQHRFIQAQLGHQLLQLRVLLLQLSRRAWSTFNPPYSLRHSQVRTDALENQLLAALVAQVVVSVGKVGGLVVVDRPERADFAIRCRGQIQIATPVTGLSPKEQSHFSICHFLFSRLLIPGKQALRGKV
jgi:hypothetical protein